MTIEVADVVDAVEDVAVRLEVRAEVEEEVPRRPVSFMVETITGGQNFRAGHTVGCSTMDFGKEGSFDSCRFNLRRPLSRGRLSRYSSYSR